MPLGAVLVWLVKHYVFGGFGQQDQSYLLFLQSQLFPHSGPLDATPLFWIWVCVGLVGSIAIVFRTDYPGPGSADPARGQWIICAVLLAALVAGGVRVGAGLWDNDKDVGRYYAQATVLHIPGGGEAVPSSVRPLTDHSRKADGARCDLVGTADVPSCVKADGMPDFAFDPRTASYAAATTALSISSGLASRVQLMHHTVHYLPGSASSGAGSGVWTAVLDGSGLQPAEGVAVWDGRSNTDGMCQFRGDHSFGRAFGGEGANSLRNLLAERFPDFVYDDGDIWGYCDGPDLTTAAPVVVVPVERQIAWRDRTVLQPAGVLVLRGSPDGKPAVTRLAVVHAGELPGQVYPISLVRRQIEAVQWLAGRDAKNRSSFGYAHTSGDTNVANPGEYLLRSNTDGHFYFVTPLVPRSSTSQALVAYAVVRADEVGSGLNDLRVYVRGDNSNPTNLSVLASRMVSYFSDRTSMVITAGGNGQLQEIIPFGYDQWRGFVDYQGQTQDYVDLSADATVTPNLVSLHTAIPAPGGQPSPAPAPAASSPAASSPSSSATCGADPATLTDAQLASCLAAFSNALDHHLHPPASPSP